MSTPSPDAFLPEADQVIAALGRLRGRRGPRAAGFRGGPGGPRGPEYLAGHAHEHAPDHPGGQGQRGPRGRFGGPALLRLLSQLAHATEALSVSDLAEHIGVDQPRASRLVQQAVERGFAAREADPEDARRTRIRITEAGEHAVHGFRGQQRADASAALEALDAAERTELARLLTKLADAWPEH